MSSIVQLKRSALSGKVPGTGSLNLGELALNTYDGKIFFRRSGSTDTIQEVVTTNVLNTGSVTITGTLTAESIVGSISASNGIVSGSSQITLSSGIGYSTLATTGSNQFTGSQNITGSLRATLTGSFGSLKVNDTLTINHGEAIISGSALVTNDLTILGQVNARQFNISVISSSVLFESGSSRFGNTLDDTHQFTGSVNVTGSLYLNGTDLAAGNAQGTYVFPNAFDFNVDDPTFGDFNSASLGYNLNFGDVETVGSPIHFVGGLSNLGDTTVIYPTSRSIDFVVDDRYVGSISSQSFYTNTTFTSSLEQGYTWVGNGSGVSYAVATSSIAGALPTGVVSGSSQVVSILSSLNTYTASNDTTNTAQNTRLTTIESVTGSYETTGRGIVSGSSQITYASISSIPSGIVSGSSQTITNLPTGTTSGSSQVDVMSTTNIARLATTGSNIFIGNQTISGSLSLTGSITSKGNVQVGSNTTDASLTLSGDNSGGDTFINFKSDLGETKVQLLGTKNGGTGGRLTVKTLQSSVLTNVVVVENNNVGIGITPLARLFVNCATNQNVRISQEGGQAGISAVNDAANTFAMLNIDANVVRIQSQNTGGNVCIGTATDFGYKLNLNGQPGANGYTAWTNWSDSRLKENVTDLVVTNVLDKICAIRPVTYNYNELSGFDEATRARRISGFIAQELMEVFPDMVGTIKRDDVDYYDTNLSNLNLYLVKAIQELKAENDTLKERLTAGGL